MRTSTSFHLFLLIVFGMSTNMAWSQPANDLCENAITLNCGQTVSGTTTGATIDAADDCTVTITAGGVWYKLSGDGSVITVSTCAYYNYDMMLSVYTGSCGSFACIGGNDDYCGMGGGSAVTFCSAVGTEYFILVHGWNGATGDFQLSASCGNALSPGFITQSSEVCSGGSTSLYLTAATTGVSVQWQQATVSGGPYQDIAGANQPTYQTPPVTSLQYYIASVSCGSTVASTPERQVNFITSVYSGYILNSYMTVCSGASIQLDYANYYYNYPGIQLQWQESSTSGGPYTNIPGATSASLNTPPITQTMYYVMQSTCSGNSVLSSEAPVFIPASLDPESAISYYASSVCPGGTIDLYRYSNSNYAGTTYQWQQASVSGGPYTDIPGATSSTITSPALSQNTYFIETATCGSFTSTSNEVAITMGPAVGLIYPSQNPVCSGGTVTLARDPYTYYSDGVDLQWKQASTQGGPYTDMPGETNPTLTTQAITVPTYFVLQASCGGFTGISNEILIDVGVYAGYVYTDNSSPICQGLSTILHADYATPGADLQWQQSFVSGGPYTDIPGGTTGTFTTPPLNQTTYFILKASCGGTTDISYNEIIVDVNTSIDPGSMIYYSPGDGTVCSGNSATLAFNAGYSGVGIQWAQSTFSGGPYTDIPGETNQFFTTPPMTQTKYYVAKSTCGTLSAITTELAVIVGVNVYQPYTTNPEVCPGGTVTLYSSSYTSGASIQWQQSTVSGGPYTDIPDGSFDNIVSPPINQTTYFVLKGSCGGVESISPEIAVSMATNIGTPNVYNYGGNPVCSGATIELLDQNYYGYPPGVIFQWRQSSTSGGPYTDIPGENLQWLITTPLTASTYFVLQAQCGMANTESNEIPVQVATSSNITGGGMYNYYGTPIICPGNSVQLYQYGNTYGSTIQWQKSSVSGGPYTDIAGANYSGFYSTDPINQTTYFIVKASCGNLSALSNETVVTARTDPGTIIQAGIINICAGSQIYLTSQNYSYGAALQWQQSTSANGTYSNIAGATDYFYQTPPLNTTTYYKLKATCGTSSASTSAKKIKVGAYAGHIEGTSNLCAGYYVNLFQAFDSTNSLAGDIYQWKQSNRRTGPFTDIPGANSNYYVSSSPLTQTTYYVLKVTCSNGSTSTTPVYCVTVNSASNDNLCQAKNLSIGRTENFDQNCATAQSGEIAPPLASAPGSQDGWQSEGGITQVNNSIWYSFIAPSNKAVQITCKYTNITGYSPQIALYRSSNNSCSGSLSLIAANDNTDFISNQASVITAYCLQAGKRYYIQVDGWWGTSGTGTLKISSISNNVTICHNLPNNQHVTMQIPGCQLATYLSHGDTPGPCVNARVISSSENEDIVAESLKVYPNPTDHDLNISFNSENEEAYQLLLIDLTGRILMTENKTAIEGENKEIIHVESLTPGIYFLVIQKGDHTIQTRIVRQ